MTGVSCSEQEPQGLTGCLDDIMCNASGRAFPGRHGQSLVVRGSPAPTPAPELLLCAGLLTPHLRRPLVMRGSPDPAPAPAPDRRSQSNKASPLHAIGDLAVGPLARSGDQPQPSDSGASLTACHVAVRDVAFQHAHALGRIHQIQNFGAHVVHRREATLGRFTLTTFLCTLQRANSKTSPALRLYGLL